MRCAMVSRAFILYLCCETTFRHLFVVSRRIYASISLPVPQCISIRFVCLFWFVSSTTTTTLWSFRNYHVRHFQRLLFCLKASHFSIIHFQDASHTHTHTHCQTERRCTTTHNTVNIVKYCAVCFLDLRKKIGRVDGGTGRIQHEIKWCMQQFQVYPFDTFIAVFGNIFRIYRRTWIHAFALYMVCLYTDIDIERVKNYIKHQGLYTTATTFKSARATNSTNIYLRF